MNKKDLLFLVLIGVLLFVVYLPIYGPLHYRFTTHDTYYSHGFLVPFVVAYLIFRKRKTLKEIKPQACFWGLPLLLLGVIVHLISVILKVNFTSYFSLPIVLMGTVLYLGGKKYAKELLFPIAFLIFMLPLPKVAVIGISFNLKMLATQASIFVVNLLGIAASASGATINYPGGYLLVGDPCSGLRSLITFLALGALFTQLINASIWKKQVVFASAIPIAIFSNLLRLVFLVIVGFFYGQEVATGLVHDISGFMVFAVGFLGLLSVTKLLGCTLCAETT